MYLVQKNHLRTKTEGYQTLKWLSHKCKNLYNVALYTIKNEYEKTSKYLSGSELYHKTCSSCGVVRGANRVKRGLYRCNNCSLELNADINGALNILQKVVPKNLFDQFQWDSGDIISPERVKLVYFTT